MSNLIVIPNKPVLNVQEIYARALAAACKRQNDKWFRELFADHAPPPVRLRVIDGGKSGRAA